MSDGGGGSNEGKGKEKDGAASVSGSDLGRSWGTIAAKGKANLAKFRFGSLWTASRNYCKGPFMFTFTFTSMATLEWIMEVIDSHDLVSGVVHRHPVHRFMQPSRQPITATTTSSSLDVNQDHAMKRPFLSLPNTSLCQPRLQLRFG